MPSKRHPERSDHGRIPKLRSGYRKILALKHSARRHGILRSAQCRHTFPALDDVFHGRERRQSNDNPRSGPGFEKRDWRMKKEKVALYEATL